MLTLPENSRRLGFFIGGPSTFRFGRSCLPEDSERYRWTSIRDGKTVKTLLTKCLYDKIDPRTLVITTRSTPTDQTQTL